MPKVCVSGYMDPLTPGHCELLRLAKYVADFGEAKTISRSEKDNNSKLIVIVNNDYQATLKKGKPFMKQEDRMEILRSLRYVDQVVLSIDKDPTVCKTIESLNPKPDIFANGGDAFNKNIPEKVVCDRLGIKMMDHLGDKTHSSRWLTGLTPVVRK